MPDFRIIVDIKEVARGDATNVAEDIWQGHAENLDASRGDFAIRVVEVSPQGAQFDTGWEPGE